MRDSNPLPARNRFDLTDPTQIRDWTKRLGISTDDLLRMIRKVGNSIAAASKPRLGPFPVEIIFIGPQLKTHRLKFQSATSRPIRPDEKHSLLPSLTEPL
jgi:hypothetical protein